MQANLNTSRVAISSSIRSFRKPEKYFRKVKNSLASLWNFF